MFNCDQNYQNIEKSCLFNCILEIIYSFFILIIFLFFITPFQLFEILSTNLINCLHQAAFGCSAKIVKAICVQNYQFLLRILSSAASWGQALQSRGSARWTFLKAGYFWFRLGVGGLSNCIGWCFDLNFKGSYYSVSIWCLSVLFYSFHYRIFIKSYDVRSQMHERNLINELRKEPPLVPVWISGTQNFKCFASGLSSKSLCLEELKGKMPRE